MTTGEDRQQSGIEEAGIPPNDPSEPAILADLAPGAGRDGASGTALIESTIFGS